MCVLVCVCLSSPRRGRLQDRDLAVQSLFLRSHPTPWCGLMISMFFDFTLHFFLFCLFFFPFLCVKAMEHNNVAGEDTSILCSVYVRADPQTPTIVRRSILAQICMLWRCYVGRSISPPRKQRVGRAALVCRSEIRVNRSKLFNPFTRHRHRHSTEKRSNPAVK